MGLLDLRISVIIPAYNVEEYIARSISSALNQKVKPFEIIVVDDGSTDNTAKVIGSYKEDIVYVFQENGGSSSARNLGIETARGNWIAFLDSDDEWVDTHLQNFKATLSKFPHIKWYGSSFKFLDTLKKKEINLVPKAHYEGAEKFILFNDYMSAFPPKAYFSSPTMIIKKSVFDVVGYFDTRKKTSEDVDMWFRIGLNFPEVGYCPVPAAIVYKRENSLSTTNSWNPFKTFDRIEECKSLASDYSEDARERIKPRIAYWVSKLVKRSVKYGDKQTLKRIKEEYFNILPKKFKRIVKLTTIFPLAIKLVQFKNRL